MREIRHHLTEALLMGYASGSLPEAFDLVVASHVSMCDDCRAALAEYEALGGEVLDHAAATDVRADAFERTMDAIFAEPMAEDDRRPAPRAADDVLPAPLRDYVGGGLEAVRWRRIGGGVKQMILPTKGEGSVRLLHIPAGTALPDHSHGGCEMTLVLQGAFADSEDRFAAGDVEVADEHLHHTPKAEEGMDCICLAASDAPLKFHGWLPKIAQRFARI